MEAFGDESCGKDATTYAIAVGTTAQVRACTEEINKIKSDFLGTETHRLHCRILFSPHQRARSPWTHLSQAQAFDLYSAVSKRINEARLRCLVGVAIHNQLPKRLAGARMMDKSGAPTGRYLKEMPLGPKQMAVFLGQGMLFPLARDYGAKNVKFWADSDVTMIDWVTGKRKATNLLDGTFAEVEGDAHQFQLQPITEAERPMLDVADFVAYISQKQSTVSSLSDGRFQKLRNSLTLEVAYMAVEQGALALKLPPKK